mmetsp:Transcript_47857/g.110899  ORF Transcript_47857/g.110899 Transcript_47857/m.110899 type:complete len:268 (-) Transcript_47857:738-1541(-)
MAASVSSPATCCSSGLKTSMTALRKALLASDSGRTAPPSPLLGCAKGCAVRELGGDKRPSTAETGMFSVAARVLLNVERLRSGDFSLRCALSRSSCGCFFRVRTFWLRSCFCCILSKTFLRYSSLWVCLSSYLCLAISEYSPLWAFSSYSWSLVRMLLWLSSSFLRRCCCVFSATSSAKTRADARISLARRVFAWAASTLSSFWCRIPSSRLLVCSSILWTSSSSDFCTTSALLCAAVSERSRRVWLSSLAFSTRSLLRVLALLRAL